MSAHRQKVGSTRYISPERRRQLAAAIQERDGQRCWVCGQEMDFHPAHRGWPESYSLDHVKKCAEGGTCQLANLRLAHRVCNQGRDRKGR
jgi:hypothetical protein